MRYRDQRGEMKYDFVAVHQATHEARIANVAADEICPLRTGSGKSSSQPWLSNELYWARAVTSAPEETRASVRCEPMKPSAPVTRIFVPA